VYEATKRSFDVLCASSALVLLSPVMLAVAVAVAVRLGRPVVFRQVRPGLHGEPFTLVKFRSMRDVDPEAGLVTDAERLTPFGRLLRSTSLDELPSLVGVLTGRLSLVGPRPLLMNYLPLYDAEQSRRHEVRPGLTGLAQVNGRNELGWDDRLRLDVEYVDRRGPLLDLQIIARTFGCVLRRTGVSDAGHVTCRPFDGADVVSGSTAQSTDQADPPGAVDAEVAA
jgi:lipopolysaccharide/colanic/teichoic acid biosynthesis glycosyltransferase